MKLKNLISLLILFFFLNFSLRANAEQWDFIGNLVSPFNTEAGLVFYPGAALTAGLILYNHKKISQRADIAARKDSGTHRVSHWGDLIGRGFLNGGYFIGQWAMGEKDNALLMLDASLFSTLMTWTLKPLVRESRPGNPNNHSSFPSGHTSLAFSFATTVALRHPWYWGIPAYMLASFIAYSRMVDHAHWLHDITAGATIGMAYAIGTNLASHGGVKNTTWLILPHPESPGGALFISKKF